MSSYKLVSPLNAFLGELECTASKGKAETYPPDYAERIANEIQNRKLVAYQIIMSEEKEEKAPPQANYVVLELSHAPVFEKTPMGVFDYSLIHTYGQQQLKVKIIAKSGDTSFAQHLADIYESNQYLVALLDEKGSIQVYNEAFDGPKSTSVQRFFAEMRQRGLLPVEIADGDIEAAFEAAKQALAGNE